VRALLATDNPLREGLYTERAAEPCVIVIFGATGDLTHRKLLPSLYSLAVEQRLPAGTSVVGFARRDWGTERFRSGAVESIQQFSPHTYQPSSADGFVRNLHYVEASFEDQAGYEELKRVCAELDQELGSRGNRLYYLATAPTAYAEIIEQLAAAGLVASERDGRGPGGWTRIVVEKPFGHDLASAHELNETVGSVFREDQVYRIDHYLGKETVQNILAFRFGNGIFESLWNREHIDHLQITVAESLGVEGRGPYYEETGALRDMVANHMLQVLALVAMEPPVALDATAIRDEKVKVLRAIHPLSPAEVARRTVRGQYGSGAIGGESVPGYRQEERVSPNSTTETFVALKLLIDNWRWAGVPFYLRHGKRLPKRSTEISIQFKKAPELLFEQTNSAALEPNVLVLRVQPNDGIALRFGAKVPGPGMQIRSVMMDFGFGSAFGGASADAYERLLLDAMQGDAALFTRRDETEAAWRIVTSILEGWHHQRPPDFPNYSAGTWGPKAAHDVIARDHRSWARL
jgi:glucose-6-phosphate 1-dehydrogenase